VKHILLIQIIVFSLTKVFCQREVLCQVDGDGKRDGKWVLYLDGNGNKLKDSTNAVYWRYTYYDHGTHIYPMGAFVDRNGEIKGSLNDLHPLAIKMLDGEYKCYERGKLKYIHVFKEGEYVSYKEYFSSGEVCTYFDYTKHDEGQPHSWYSCIYDKKGNVINEEWVRKDAQGKWPKMRG
jgi:hypothetical protein